MVLELKHDSRWFRNSCIGVAKVDLESLLEKNEEGDLCACHIMLWHAAEAFYF